MTDCNGCGRCCNPVHTIFTQEHIARKLGTSDNPDDMMFPENRRWFLNDLTPISRKEGMAMTRDYMPEGVQVLQYMDNHTKQIRHDLEERILIRFFKCKNYDEEKRECGIYDTRPPICRNFPWYEGELDHTRNLPPECSYNVDIGKPVQLGPTRRWNG